MVVGSVLQIIDDFHVEKVILVTSVGLPIPQRDFKRMAKSHRQ